DQASQAPQVGPFAFRSGHERAKGTPARPGGSNPHRPSRSVSVDLRHARRLGFPPTKSSRDLAIVAIIPARFGATRLPGKPLADIHGKTLIERVWGRVTA